MGLRLFSSSAKRTSDRFAQDCSHDRYREPSPKKALVNTTPDPNPYSFTILAIVRGECYDLIKVKYNHCTTFEGIKLILTQKNAVHLNTTYLDPHFFKDGIIVARFAPTEEGEKLARNICNPKKEEEL